MDPFYRDWCKMIMDRMEKHPIRGCLARYEPANSSLRNFKFIYDALNENKYITPFDWSIDMTNLIYSYIDSNYEGTGKYFIGQEILEWLENKLDHSPKNFQDFVNHRLQKQIQILTDCIEGIGTIEISKSTDLKKHISPAELKTLQDNFESISDPQTLINVMFTLKKYIPELDADNPIQITQSKITQQCFQELQILFKHADNDKKL
ncbi:hypothetical protein TVAG_293520 [Trichomonas vaginalis G3]|uniref:Uncharacterized protein n=1 Tax=Trichomonas vaginalis (strain ATCC PRA-98 / G3) TaxID=412133 RepID=A2FCM5_TRIV3|nr:acetylation-dependent protein binding [Trichomonas vaginalis G3]EAX97347.1 hypothetical protein TVAG_293520 [Trichomonas vaginalis G3]KAI5533139.1 acetylation-dependent protein binding [Trichomonas vaginalis G3]|eukprot:XP_001310277.1 hypothetical protein [Trichomonas vaginalis G3]